MFENCDKCDKYKDNCVFRSYIFLSFLSMASSPDKRKDEFLIKASKVASITLFVFAITLVEFPSG